MMRFALVVGLLGLGCVGSIESEPADVRPTDVSLFASTNEGAAATPDDAPISAHEDPEPEAQPAAEPVETSVPVLPKPAQSEPAAAPVLPEGCEWVDATSYTCPNECSAEWPVPSAVDESGRLQAFTRDGRQLCGGTVSDGCGHTVELGLPCEGDDACGGEGIWNPDGSPSEERFICAECRVETDPAALEACAAAGRPVAVVGCEKRADNVQRFNLAGCVGLGIESSDGRIRYGQCCVNDPL